MKLILFSHFYNEQFLLPYWLKHHKKLFDHGVLVDYGSTDRSVEIVKEICPDWEIRESTYKDFGAEALDKQMMAIEREYDGWKMILNTTEFVIHHNLREYLATKFLDEFVGVRARAAFMTDPPHLTDVLVDDRPLYFQRHFGHFEDTKPRRRGRMIHRASDGAYQLGRHGTSHKSYDADDIFMLWFGLSPFKQIVERKLQIQTRIPENDKRRGFGRHHLIQGEEHLREILEVEQGKMGDLLDDAAYLAELKKVRHTLWPEIQLDGKMKDLLDD